MSVDVLFASLSRYWYLLLAGLLLGSALAVAAGYVAPKKYEASSLLLLSAPSIAELSEGSDYVESRMPTYAALVTSTPVLDGARRSLGLTEDPAVLANSVTVDVEVSTLLIDLTVEWPDQQGAANLANAVAQSYVALAPRLDNNDRPVLRVGVVEQAVPAPQRAGPSFQLLAMIGAVLGLTVGLLAAVRRGAFPSKVTNARDVFSATALEVMALIRLPRNEQRQSASSRAVRRRASLTASNRLDSFPALYSRLGLGVFERRSPSGSQPGDGEREPRVVVIVSCSSSGGNDAAMVAQGLAATCVASGQNSVVITPDAAAFETVSELLPPSETPGAGHSSVLRSDLLASTDDGVLTLARLTAAIASAKVQPDVVLIAAGPIEADANTRTYLELGQHVVLTARFATVRFRSLQRSAELIREAGVPIAGVVATTATRRSASKVLKTGRRVAARPVQAVPS